MIRCSCYIRKVRMKRRVQCKQKNAKMPASIEMFRKALKDHAPNFDSQLRDIEVDRLGDYYSLLMKWNPRLHLVAPCSPREFATRHVLESLMLLRHLPAGARIVDVGSGAGLPIMPCLMLREDLRAMLIESSQRKAVFLREVLRGLVNPVRAQLIPTRFEETAAPKTDFVTSRALDRFQRVLPTLISWAPPASTLLLFAGNALRRQIEALLPTLEVERIPRS